ncbi:sugar ABC transporter permease [Paenibacillus sp. J31TS4]|uniref:extracellular solute-binding protein n=1 Tax=Paenibacillus sp. J31TS4 TaxID=2807195 RepID=UPI001B03E8B4|nr:extracellular solute-binding protein [Paenibacillus sp. J31TS4]GIP40531.1 sugar ABC transporter permease [Paenibacillus sp. J31TS4]
MRTKKRLSLLIAASMLGGTLAGCGGEPAGGADPQKAGAESANLNPTGMPIVKEPISLTFFTGKSSVNGNNFEETMLWKEYGKLTNMNVKFELVPFETLTEKRNLTLASGDYPDAFYTARLGANDLAKYGSQGVFIPLNTLIDQYAPNLKKLMEQYPEIRKGLTMPDGNIYSFPTFYDPSFLSLLIGTPLWINKEWLGKLQMAEPQTTEEFYEYLKAVKATDLNGNGQQDEIPFSGESLASLFNQLKGAWGLGNRGLGHTYVDVEPGTEKLRFFKTDPKYKELLQYVHKLYKEGLVDKEIFTIKSNALYAKGQMGTLGSTIVANPATLMNQKTYIGLGALKGPHGDQLYSQMKVPLVNVGSFAITDKNKYPAETVRWMDYFYSEEGMKLFFMGKEGVTYTETGGKFEYVKDITSNPQGLSQDQALAKYLTYLGGSYPGFVTEKFFKGSEALPESIEAGKKAAPHAVKEIWGKFNFTESEMEVMSTVGKDIETYITEMEAKLVNGSASFDDWDKYVATVKKMGLDRYMQTYQSAYDRYSKN